MGKEKNPLPFISNLFTPDSRTRNYVFYFFFFLFLISLSVGVVSTLWFKSFSFALPPAIFFTSSSQTLQTSSPQSTPPPPLLPPPPPTPRPPPKSTTEVLSVDHASNGTSNHTGDISLKQKVIPLMHNTSDKELLWRASLMLLPQVEVEPFVPKVAFIMFLTPSHLPLAPLWEMFFKVHQGLYSIYFHPHPSYKDSWPQDSVFYNRRILAR